MDLINREHCIYITSLKKPVSARLTINCLSKYLVIGELYSLQFHVYNMKIGRLKNEIPFIECRGNQADDVISTS